MQTVSKPFYYFSTRHNRSNGGECVVHYDVQQQVPPVNSTIVVKHTGADSRTGLLNHPFYWRLKPDNNEVNQQVSKLVLSPITTI